MLATADEAAGYADGNFKKAWTDLRDLMEPRTQVTLQKNKEAYNDMKMRFGEDPTVLMTKLKELRQKMAKQGRLIPDEEFLMDVLSKLPASKHKYGDPPYGIKKALIERDIADSTKQVTYESVQLELGNRFQELQREASQTKEKVDVALNAETTSSNNNGNSGSFQRGGGRGGRYGNSGGRGGRFSGRSGGGGRYPGRGGRGQRDMSHIKCYHCGKPGHVKVNCPEWKKKQGQSGQATAMTATAEKTYSVSLMATAVAGCQREEYSYVPADQEFGEPTHWSFDAYEQDVEDEDIPESESQEVIAFESPYEMPENLIYQDEEYHTQVWRSVLESMKYSKPAAKRTSVDELDDRKPAAKKRTPIDPPADLEAQSDLENKEDLEAVPLRMVPAHAPEVPTETEQVQSEFGQRRGKIWHYDCSKSNSKSDGCNSVEKQLPFAHTVKGKGRTFWI